MQLEQQSHNTDIKRSRLCSWLANVAAAIFSYKLGLLIYLWLPVSEMTLNFQTIPTWLSPQETEVVYVCQIIWLATANRK